MKQEKIICPACGEPTVPVMANRPDGWRMVKIPTCMFCGAELPGVSAGNGPANAPAGDAPGNGPVSALSALLGAGETPHPTLAPDADGGKFCRRCAFCVIHPFRNFCTRQQRDVDPMGDCPEFKVKVEL